MGSMDDNLNSNQSKLVRSIQENSSSNQHIDDGDIIESVVDDDDRQLNLQDSGGQNQNLTTCISTRIRSSLSDSNLMMATRTASGKSISRNNTSSRNVTDNNLRIESDKIISLSPNNQQSSSNNNIHKQTSSKSSSKSKKSRRFRYPTSLTKAKPSKWIYNQMSMINCCMVRTDSIGDIHSAIEQESTQNTKVKNDETQQDLDDFQEFRNAIQVANNDEDDDDELLFMEDVITGGGTDASGFIIGNNNAILVGDANHSRPRHPNTPLSPRRTPLSMFDDVNSSSNNQSSNQIQMIHHHPLMAAANARSINSSFIPISLFGEQSPGQQQPQYIYESPAHFHTQIDYINCLVPDLLAITNCSFYWGKIDRYEAERFLDGRPEGTFLLRDSAQDDHLFSVSFRRFDRSLHARIEHREHRFSFDSHDPGVFSSPTVTGLIEHYKDPSHCMFFEPILTKPLNRTFTFSLQHLARVNICERVSYDQINFLPLPQVLKHYLKEYHYRIKVRTRHYDEQLQTTAITTATSNQETIGTMTPNAASPASSSLYRLLENANYQQLLIRHRIMLQMRQQQQQRQNHQN